MKTRQLFFSAAIAFFCIAFFGCGPSRPKIIQVNPAFSEYISGYTSGMITRTSGINIELSEAVVSNPNRPGELPDSNLLKDLFSFSPKLNGKAVWKSNREVVFIPDEPMPVNQFYTVDFDLRRLAKVKRELGDFQFQFSTYQQTMFVNLRGLSNYDNYNIEWQYIEGSVVTSDFADTVELKKTLTATQNGKKLPLRIEKSYYKDYQYNFYFDSVERKITAGKVEVSWDGKAIQSMSKGKQEVDVNALGDFSVESAKVLEGDDQYVEVRFSEPIDESQNLKGIISIQGIDNLTFSIDYNTVNVYLPQRYVGEKKLTVSNGVKNVKGYKKLESHSENLIFEAPKPLVRIKGSGSILPNSNGLIFPFEAISLKSVDVRVIKIFETNVHHFLQVNNLDESDHLTRFGKIIAEKKISLDYDKSMDLKLWNKHVIDLDKLIKPEPGAIYRVSIRFSKKDAICDCQDESEEDDSEDNYYYDSEPELNQDNTWTEKNWNGWDFEGFSTWGYYNEDYSACNKSYYYGKAVSRNILASDLGMIFKLDEDKTGHAFISDLITTKPIANASVLYYDYAKQLIASGTTDANGMFTVKLKEKPFLMIAKLGSQRGYLKLRDGYTNSLSKFDVEGEVLQKGIKGFIYGERGVWRPGDSLYLTFILQNKDKLLPENHPVNFEIQDPNGQVIYQITKNKSVNGMYDFRSATSSETPTGNYTAIVTIGNSTFTKRLKIETVKPNRLKIYLDDKKRTADSMMLSVKWLHGAVAKDLRVTVSAKINAVKTTFDQFKNYEFDSPMRRYSANEAFIFDGNLNKKGETMLPTKLDVGKTAPGMLRATYITKVFEKGGDFSIDRTSFVYSPFKTYIGIQSPMAKNADHTLETGNNYKFDVIAISEKGNLVNNVKLNVKIYKIQWRWWYEKDAEEVENYISRSGTIVVKDTMITAQQGKGHFNFKVNYPEYGRYLITVTDMAGEHQTGTIVSIDWPYLSRGNRKDNENATMLNFSCDKEKYIAGEKIKLSFPSPAAGSALISIETRTKVLRKFWIRTEKGETTHEIPATVDMAPNAYIHVTLIQPHANTVNDLPIRMYGIVPVMVDDPQTHLLPEIKMLDVLKPESTASIKVSEKSGRRMTYTLAIVDDGLLDLTNYKTPQPWSTFYAKEALGVKTWDMYDQVIGAYAGKLNKLLSIGGDGDGNAGKNPKANRFKPMVRFVGPFTLEAGQEKTHAIQIPNYVGSVRIMVVAQNDGAYGETEKTVMVKKPLMLLATLPRVVGPGEKIALPVNVFAMENHVKDVKITVEVNDLFTVEGNKTQSMKFDQIGDDVVNFNLSVAQKMGIAKVKITAVSGNEKAVEEIEIDVRPSNPKVYEAAELSLEAGQDWNTDLKFKGLSGTNKASIEVSSFPSMGLEKRLGELMQYPHGCLEQTTSTVFPQLYVDKVVSLDEKQRNKISGNVKAALKKFQLFQTSNGGFAYWPGEGYESEWGTNYVGHFIIEAEKNGYSLPTDMKRRWIKYQQQQAKNWSVENNPYVHSRGKETNEVTQAYRLYTLALSSNPELGAMNRLREERGLSSSAKWRLAAAYQLIGQKEVALQLIQNLPATVTAYRELSYSFGSDLRDKAMILETLGMLKLTAKADPLAKEIAKSLSSDRWMSTQETAYSLIAMCAYAGVNGNEKGVKFTYKLNNGKAVSEQSAKKLEQLIFTEKDFTGNAPFQLKNNGSSTLFVKIVTEGIPLVGDQKSSESNLKMSVVYKDINGMEIKPDKLVQGTEFKVEVTLYNPGEKGIYKEMALTQIFASGWEIHNSRMDGEEESLPSRYRDIRDDRVYTYFDLGPKQSKTFTLQLNATYMGRFYLPTIYCEAMYDHGINAKIHGKWVEIVKEK